MIKDVADMFDQLTVRLDGIENMIKLVLVNDLIGNVEQIERISNDGVDSAVRNHVQKYNLKCKGSENINGIEIFVIEIPEGIKVKTKDLKGIKYEIKELCSEREPVYIFKYLNGRMRRSLIQEGLSFVVYGKEIHVSNKK